MKRQKKYFVLLFFTITVLACAQEGDDQLYRPETKPLSDTLMHVGFDKNAVGIYGDKDVEADFKNIKWVLTKNRAAIVNDTERGNVLQVFYPKGSVGPQEGGIQFVRTLTGSKEYYLDYYLKFDADFDFNKGGKLPGLTSGGDKYTGGVNPTEGDGWSARYMWTNNMPDVYLYYIDMAETYGEPIYFNVKFERNRWYRLTQHIKLNDVDKSNAIITIWVNGIIAAEKTDFRLRAGNKGLIDSFYFSTFHGGATTDWAPRNDSYLYIDNIMITTTAVKF